MKKHTTQIQKLFFRLLAAALCVVILGSIVGCRPQETPGKGDDPALNAPSTELKPEAAPTEPAPPTEPVTEPQGEVEKPAAPVTPKPETPKQEAPAPETPAPEAPAPEVPVPNTPYDTFEDFHTGAIDTSATASVDNQAAGGVMSAPVTIGGADSNVTANVPQGVTISKGTHTLTLSVTTMDKSGSGITPGEDQLFDSLDVHMDGVAANNTVPMLITLKHYLPMGLNNGNVHLYHVEHGNTLPMNRTAVPTNHNEFSYDPLTGNVTLAMASFSEVAVVANANNPWDGTSAESFAGGTGTEADPFLISTAHELAYFRDLVDAGNTFAGQYVKLNNSIHLDHVNFDPIGYGYECKKYMPDGKTFNGTFDGGNRTIFGLHQNGWELGDKYSYSMAGGGLFASVVDATIKNLKISDANIRMECVDMGILVGYSQGNCTYENIGIYESKIANYQRATGGLVGEVSPRRNADGTLLFNENTHTFKNIDIGFNVVVGSLWGDFDASVGGVLGARWDDDDSTKVVMENVTVACRLDVYNDVTSAYKWHSYRRAGMLIGNTDTPAADGRTAHTATATFLTCRNVTVHWGDWVNYHYCQFTNENNPGRNYPWVRVEEGENCDAYANPRYGQPLDINGNTVTGTAHVHKEGDTCHLLLPFAQLYGGGQGIYGAVSHEGVTMSTPVYTVTYIVEGEVDEIIYITDNSVPYTLKPTGDHMQWIDREGISTTQIPAGNTASRVFHYDDAEKLIAHFVDMYGQGVSHVEFTEKTTYEELMQIAPKVPEIAGYFGHWEQVDMPTDRSIVVKPVYTIEEGATELSHDVSASEMFDMLSQGGDLVMSQNLSGTQGSGNKAECAIIVEDPTQEDKASKINLNGYDLHFNFASNANKDWRIFDIMKGSSLTVTGGINHGGALIMEITALNGNASPILFDLAEGAKLILERGTVIELYYPKGRANDVSMFGTNNKPFALDPADYPFLQYEHDTENCVKRITVIETTTIIGK